MTKISILFLVSLAVCCSGEEFRTLEGADYEESIDEDFRSHVLTELKYLRAEDQKNKALIDQLQDITSSLQAASNTAFFAYMDVGGFQPSSGEVIPFNTAPVNAGRNYNTSTSIYTCPEHGLYLFSAGLYTGLIGAVEGYDAVGGNIVLDGVEVVQMFSRTQSPVDYMYKHISCTAIVDCPKGGQVAVQAHISGTRIYGAEDSPFTVFTGYALHFHMHP